MAPPEYGPPPGPPGPEDLFDRLLAAHAAKLAAPPDPAAPPPDPDPVRAFVATARAVLAADPPVGLAYAAAGPALTTAAGAVLVLAPFPAGPPGGGYAMVTRPADAAGRRYTAAPGDAAPVTGAAAGPARPLSRAAARRKGLR